jgi:hypothetical protein
MGGQVASHFLWCFMIVDPFDVDENTRNLYLIRRQLADTKKNIDTQRFDFYVGDWHLIIDPNPFMEHVDYGDDDRITKHELLDVYLYEKNKLNNDSNYISLDLDYRFIGYKPIKYNEYGSSNGERIPINHLCELVKYLYRLSNLSVFM